MGTVVMMNRDAEFDYAGALDMVEPEVLRRFGRDASLLICWSAEAMLAAAKEERFDDILKSTAPFHGMAQCFGATPVVSCVSRLTDAAALRDGATVLRKLDELFQELGRFTPLLAQRARTSREAANQAA